MTIEFPSIFKKAQEVREQDAERKERYLDFGWETMNAATEGYDYGVFFLPAPPNIGKCLAEGTVIPDLNGKLVPIENFLETNVLSLAENYKLKLIPASKSTYSGIKECYKVTTATGRSILTSDNHPFLKLSGWTALKDLQIKDRIALAREIPLFGTEEITDNACIILGLLIGDGSVIDVNPSFTTANTNLVLQLQQAITIECGVHHIAVYTKKNNKASSYVFSKPKNVKAVTYADIAKKLGLCTVSVLNALTGKRCNELTRQKIIDVAKELNYIPMSEQDTTCELVRFLKKYNVYSKVSGNKDIPEQVMNAPKDKVATFIKYLYACDGSAYINKRGDCGITYTSKSEKLVDQLQFLLSKFGIQSSKKPRKIKCNGKICYAFQLDILDRINIVNFIEQIGIAEKEEKLKQIIETPILRKSRNSALQNIPKEIREYINQKLRNTKISKRSIDSVRGYNRALHRSIAVDLGKYIKDDYLINLGNSDIVWDTIVSIESVGPKKTYDIMVPKTHNFIANGFIVHNSTIQLNAYTHLIEHTPEVQVLDVSLDDDFATRFRNSIARLSKVKINKVRYAFTRTEEENKRVFDAETYWFDAIAPRLTIVECTDFNKNARNLSQIKTIVQAQRDMYGDKKLVVTIDGFHNIVADDFRGGYNDKIQIEAYTSNELVTLAESEKCSIIVTSHTPKGSLRRGLDQESVKGSVAAGYDAKIMGALYSDYKINRENAEVFGEVIINNEDGTVVKDKFPIIELDIVKNKTSEFNSIIFFEHYPAFCLVEEADPTWQNFWRDLIYSKNIKKPVKK
jgi:intein/homing endonuclease